MMRRRRTSLKIYKTEKLTSLKFAIVPVSQFVNKCQSKN